VAKYSLSKQAQQSLKAIKEYSTKRFGLHQTSIYLANLKDTMGLLAESPQIGTKRTDLFADWICYSYCEGSHTIYYEVISASAIAVIDVLHQSMEPTRYLSEQRQS
jgi:toxin ParE1/3/4